MYSPIYFVIMFNEKKLYQHHGYIFCCLCAIDEGLLNVGSFGRTGDERAKAIEGSLCLILDARATSVEPFV